MKRILLLLASITLNSNVPCVVAQGTAFSYQGRLTEGGRPVNGRHELRTTLHNAATGGLQIGPILTNATTMTEGLFALTLDFGAGAFNGEPRWLELAVRPEGDGAFALL